MIAIVAASILPNLVLSVIIGRHLSKYAVAQAEGEIIRAVENLAHQQQGIIKNSEQMLKTIAVSDAILMGDTLRAGGFLRRLHRENTQYATILATDPYGMVVASALFVQHYGIADRDYLQEAIRHRAFTVGPYLISRSTDKPVIPLAYPILNMEGDIRFVLVAALQTSYIQESINHIQLPAGSVLELVDKNGIRILRNPADPRYPPGEARDEALWTKAEQNRGLDRRTITRSININVGIRSDPAFKAVLSVPLSAVNIRARTSPFQFTFIGGLAMTLSILFAAWLYNENIGRRFAQLVRQAAALGDQEDRRRRPVLDGEDELDLLRRTLMDSTDDLLNREREQRESAQAIEASLREKEVLLREVHHRVKNNFQVISSLLSLQTMAIDDPHILKIFEESRNRIQSMAIIHERLYRSDNFSYIDFGEYARSMAEQVSLTYWQENQNVFINVSAGPTPLNLDIAVPLGLILNELFSNCFKHAFPLGGEGLVEVCMEEDGPNRGLIVVEDDGRGLPADFSQRREQSLGMTLIHTLSEQIRGNLTVESPGRIFPRGTRFAVSFPLPCGFCWTPAGKEAILNV